MMTEPTTKILRLEFIEGGEKFELFQQLFNVGLRDIFGKRLLLPHFPIKVRKAGEQDSVSVGYDHLDITGLVAKDTLGEAWAIFGTYPTVGPIHGASNYTGRRGGGKPFTGVYNTRTREGFIEIDLS